MSRAVSDVALGARTRDTAPIDDQRIENVVDRRESPDSAGISRDVRGTWWCVVELAATFALFAGLMHFLYLGPPGIPQADAGLPGHDSFYHVKMAALLPEIGLVDTFPWLRTTVFNEHFVNHHYGFHVLLSPFVHLAHWATGDYVPGGRWFITASFGVSMALVQLLLMVRGVQHRWVWIALFLMLPSQFYGRHFFVRAINPSLICMLLLCLCMFTRRFRTAGAVIAVSIHIYLGSVLFAPALVVAMFVSGLLGVLGREGKGLREFWGWKLAFWCFLGWLVGLATHPYGGLEILDFLRLQVLGSGLTPDIPVGREWKSYTPAWYFVRMCGLTITVVAVALCARIRLGPRLEADEFALLLINLLFLMLVLKARRFIEYWPVFATLSAAYLARPMRRLFARSERRNTRLRSWGTVALMAAGLGFLVACSFWLLPAYYPDRSADGSGSQFLAEWKFWTLLAGIVSLVPIAQACVRCGTGRATTVVLASAVGAGFLALVGTILNNLATRAGAPGGRIDVGWPYFSGLLCVYAVVAFLGSSVVYRARRETHRPILAALVAAGMVLVVVVPAGTMFARLQRDTKCLYDLPALRALMAVLERESEPNDVVFTDDWDVFPVYFYLNHRNHYVVGLDPKFSHEKDPVLWERYVQISRGKVPTVQTVATSEDGRTVEKKINVRLTDIRDYFDARFVIVDRDHRTLANKLDAAPDFAKRIFPPVVPSKNHAPYLLYHVAED